MKYVRATLLYLTIPEPDDITCLCTFLFPEKIKYNCIIQDSKIQAFANQSMIKSYTLN